MRKIIPFIVFSFLFLQNTSAQQPKNLTKEVIPAGSFSCKVDGASWIPKDGQRYTGLLTYKMQLDTTKPKEEAIIINEENSNHDLIMMEIPFIRGSSAPISGVKISLTIGAETYSAIINNFQMNQHLSEDGKKVYLTGSVSRI